MSLKDNVYFLGLGCAGGKLHKEFIKMNYKGGAANGSEQDLKALGDVPTKYKLNGFDGFGGKRDKAVDCLTQNADFMNFVENIKEDIVFVLFGGGGSTGSGCATLLSELLVQNVDEYGYPVKTVCPVIALPSSDEPIVKHSNAYQAVCELQDIEGLGATFFINNDVSSDYDYINSNFARMLDTFLSNDSYGTLNNFDESERMEMLKDNGAMVFSLISNDKKRSLMLDKLTRSGIFAPIESNGVCENIGILHSSSNQSDILPDEVVAEVGKPNNIFEGYNAKSTLIAVSGLDYPVSHVSKLGELAQKAFDERQRNRSQTTRKKLEGLSFMDMDVEKTKSNTEMKKCTSKFEVMRRKQQEKLKQ